MKSQREENSKPLGEVERIVYHAMCDLGWIIPQTEDDVRRAEIINSSTKGDLPERLRDPYAAFDQLCGKGMIDRQYETQSSSDSETPVRVFGALIQLLRRQRRLSLEDLAEKSRVDIGELVSIEQDPSFEPRPRTVHQLAGVLGLPRRTLVKLSNLTQVHDDALKGAAIRFAARSSSMAELSREERQALTEFVHFLVSHEKMAGEGR